MEHNPFARLTKDEHKFLSWSLNNYIENSLSESENNKSQIYQIQEILDKLNPSKKEDYIVNNWHYYHDMITNTGIVVHVFQEPIQEHKEPQINVFIVENTDKIKRNNWLNKMVEIQECDCTPKSR